MVFFLRKFWPTLFAVFLGSLLAISWNFSLGLPLLFVVFALLLRLVDRESKLLYQFFRILIPFFLAWNVSTLWWVWNASIGGFFSMIIANTLYLSASYVVYAISKKYIRSYLGRYLIWGSGVLTLEYIHYNWEGNFPWLNIGNAFSHSPEFVQWISYTGIAGLSLWVILVNAIVHYMMSQRIWNRRFIVILLGIIFIPMIASFVWLQIDDSFRGNKDIPWNQVVIVQPNIDSYDEKFIIPIETQIEILMSLSLEGQQRLDSQQLSLWLWPETAIPSAMHSDHISSYPYLAPILDYTSQHSNVSLFTGIVAYKKDTVLSKNVFYNAGIYIDEEGPHKQVHIKSKLVPGSEVMPYHRYLTFLQDWVIDLGGNSETLGVDTNTIIFERTKDGLRFVPIICYESVFGAYTNAYVQRGADMICLITNDDWWGNTSGHVQHLNYGRLRAVETRRYIARSANTGISAVITPYGSIQQQLGYRNQGVLTASIPSINYTSFYNRYGDYIYSFFSKVFFLSILYLISRRIKRRKQLV